MSEANSIQVVEGRSRMADPQRLQENPVFMIIDAAIRKDISWREARVRLRELVAEQPELFRGIELEPLQDLEDDEP